MTLFGDLLSNIFDRRYPGGVLRSRSGRSLEDLCAELLTSTGEVSGMALARQILDRYAEMDDDAKRAFFAFVTSELDIDPVDVAAALQVYRTDQTRQSYEDFMQAAEPRRQELARRLNQIPGATAKLVAMRSDLLRFARDDLSLARFDSDLRHLFQSWFNRGFLVLLPISWESPAHILEKIIAYEAVHAIDSWDDLRRRLQPPDRRCFGFFHPAMPNEPLIFVEVALTKGIATSIPSLLDPDRRILQPNEADTAVFYSISNCQKGLAGISFGNSLIKQVVRDLSRSVPELKTFVTLSPIPGLRAWADENGVGHQLDEGGDVLKRLTAHYLTTATRSDGQPRDPVARFHLNNGALVHEIHVDADASQNGIEQSGGAMVNYLYDDARISENHEAYATKSSVVASSRVRNLAKQAQITPEREMQ